MEDETRAAEIAHVVFADRVGFFTLPIERKRLLELELTEAVLACPTVRQVPDTMRILLDSGDGVALVFFGDPLRAAEAASYIRSAIQSSTESPLRIGCHSGPVFRRKDISGKWNVTGPGIDKAQRVMACSDGTNVLCSEAFAENLRAFERWHDRFTDEEEREVKHGERIRIWRLLIPDLLDEELLYGRGYGESNPGVRDERGAEANRSRLLPPPGRGYGKVPIGVPEEHRQFVGRRKERAELVGLIGTGRARVYTISGVGGIGKTSLALHAARQLTDTFADGICFVDCEDVSSEVELLHAILAGCDLPECRTPGEVSELLDGRHLLLLLDGLDRVGASGLSALEEILEASPTVKALITRREACGLSQEKVLQLGPLSGAGASGEGAELFWEVASKVAPNVSLAGPARKIALDILQAIEAVPLGIVLTASRLRTTSPEELLSQVLALKPRTPPRPTPVPVEPAARITRSVQDAFLLLTPDERRLLKDLSCFRGFFLEDAMSVLSNGDQLRDGVAALKDGGLVSGRSFGPRMRFRVVGAVLSLLEADPLFKSTRALHIRHADYYAIKASMIRARADSGERHVVVEQLWQDLANYRAAAEFALAIRDFKNISSLMNSLGRLFVDEGLDADFELLAKGLSSSGEWSVALRAEIAHLEAVRARRKRDFPSALSWLTLRLRLIRETGDRDAETETLLETCEIAICADRLEDANAALAGIDASSAPRTVLAATAVLKGRIQQKLGNHEQALAMAGQAWNVQGVPEGMPSIGVQLSAARLYAGSGNAEQAEVVLLRALSTAAKCGYADSTRAVLLELIAVSDQRGARGRTESYLGFLLAFPPPPSADLRRSITQARHSFGAKHGEDKLRALAKLHSPRNVNEAILRYCEAFGT